MLLDCLHIRRVLTDHLPDYQWVHASKSPTAPPTTVGFMPRDHFSFACAPMPHHLHHRQVHTTASMPHCLHHRQVHATTSTPRRLHRRWVHATALPTASTAVEVLPTLSLLHAHLWVHVQARVFTSWCFQFQC
jgi:hypothetical protein